MADDKGSESTPLLRESPVKKTKGALLASRRWVTVEPVVTGTALAIGFLASVQTQYFNHYFTQLYNRTATENGTGQCQTGNASGEEPDPTDHLIQQSVSVWVTYAAVCTQIGPIPIAFLLSCYSDHVGRKLPMTAALIGALANSALNFVAVLFDLPLYVFLISALVGSCTGGRMLAISLCQAYVADFTTVKNRMFHFVVLEILLFICVGFPQVILGFVIEDLGGYATPYAITLVIILATLVYIWFPRCLPETVQVEARRSGTPVRDALRDASRMLKLADGSRRQRVVFYLYLFILFMMVGFGVASLQIVLVYVLGAPFCLSPTKVGYYFFTVLIVLGVGCMVGGALLPLCLSIFGLMYASFISTQLYFIATALASDTLALYLATAVGSLRLLAVPACKAATSQMVKPTEQGTLFSIVGTLNNLAELVFPVFLQSVYTSTLYVNNHIVFYLAAGLTFIPLVATIVLQYISRTLRTPPGGADHIQRSDNDARLPHEAPPS